MRTDQEILDRILFMRGHDVMEMTLGELSGLLPLEALKPMLNPKVVAGIEERGVRWDIKPRDHDAITQKIIEYLTFAWEKANNSRGISCMRSILHFSNWFWLLGDDDMAAFLLRPYTYYGKPQLVAISEKVGFDWKKEDNGVWVNAEGETGISADDALKMGV